MGIEINGALTSALRTVVGTTADTEGYNTLYGIAYEMRDHAHGTGLCIPTGAAGITVTGLATSYKLGAKISLVTSVIAEPFDFHFLNIESASDNDIYEIHIFKGATTGSGTAVSKARFVKTAAIDAITGIPLMTPILSSAQKTFAQLSNEAANASTCIISLQYHTY